MELLREAMPKISRIAVLTVSQTPSPRTYWAQIQAPAQALKVTPQRHEVLGPDEIEHAFASLIKGRAQGLSYCRTLSPSIVERNRGPLGKEPAAGDVPVSLFVEAGGLMSYGTNLPTCTGGPPPTWTRS